MARKVFKFKGYELEELRKMSMEDLMKIMPSRTRRTLKRGLTARQKKLLEKIGESDPSQKPVRTHQRDMPVLPQMVGKMVAIYNGKEFMKIEILPEMIGHYLGEYALSRSVVRHSAPGVGATRSSLFVPIK